jgi:MFS transporter, DHA2 family, multidrug resistance protein
VAIEYGRRRTIIVIGIMMAALLQTLDSTIVNVALPTIEGNIGASIDDGTWIITGYIISNVIAIPLAPFLLQRLGRRQYFVMSIAGFTIASLLCGTATTLPLLVFYRVVQGAFGGGLIATSQIILRDTFPPEKIGSSSALFAVALTVGPALGPTLGGWLTDNLSWPWVFEINLVPGAIAAFIMLTMLRNPAEPKKLAFDWAGIGFLAIGLGSLQYVLDEGERHDWFGDGSIVAFALASVAGLAAFACWELFGTRRPIVDLRVFRYRNVAVGAATAILLGMVMFGPTVMLPQYTQGILGFTPTMSGMLMLVRAIPVVLLTPFVARLAGRIDTRIIIVTGCIVNAVSFALLGLRMTTQSDFGTLAVVVGISGVGQALVFVPLLVAVIGSVGGTDGPKASSFISLSFQLGASIVSTMLVTVFDRRTFFHSDVFRASVNANSPFWQHVAYGPAALATLARIAQQQATNAGFADAIWALVPLALAAIVLALALRRPPRVAGPATVPAPVMTKREALVALRR